MHDSWCCPGMQGTVLLDMSMQPQAVWRFEAVLVLLSGFWPPRGLVSGAWPPGSASPGQPRWAPVNSTHLLTHAWHACPTMGVKPLILLLYTGEKWKPARQQAPETGPHSCASRKLQ